VPAPRTLAARWRRRHRGPCRHLLKFLLIHGQGFGPSGWNGISSYEVARALGVTQKTAWFMLHRIRLAMQDGSVERLRGRVEADETFIGGKVRNMPATKRRRVMGSKRGGTYSKAIVVGLLERDGKVRGRVVDNTLGSTLQSVVRGHMEPGTEVITDAARGYLGLSKDFLHSFIGTT
jgi:hypothetical protein